MQRPNFLIVGAAKAGTTALYRYLSQHDRIYMPTEIKESFFLAGITRDTYDHPTGAYAREAVSDLQSYLALFDLAQQDQAIGEACVAYLYFYEQAIKNIHSVAGPDCKIIISLRHPVERAYSNYLHHLRNGFETESFERALDLEAVRLKENWWWGFQYRPVSMYYAQVNAYFDSFPRKNIKVILNEDLSRDPKATLNEIFAFLGVGPNENIDTSVRFNPSGVPSNRLLHYLINKRHPLRRFAKLLMPATARKRLRSSPLINRINSRNLKKPPLSEELRRGLCAEFSTDSARLSRLIGRDLSSWLE